MKIVTPTAVGTVGTRIRAYLGEQLLADSRRVLLFRKSPMKLYYCFPKEDLAEGAIDRENAKTMSTKLGSRANYAVELGSKRVENGAFELTEPEESVAELGGYIALQFGKMDRWFEEEEELIGHPRDPYTRIDVRRSSRHVRVEVEGTTVVETNRPLLLLETGLQLRYYLPKDDVNWEYLEESDTETVCPYKGRSRYWSIMVNGTEISDVLWNYPEPFDDAAPVKDALGLAHEKVDVWVDGEKLEKEQSYFSK